MTPFEAVILGAVQGMTEFLPISSSGHLVVARQLLGEAESSSSSATSFSVLVHLGSLLAIAWVLRRDLWSLVYPRIDWNKGLLLVYVSIPAAIVGFCYKDYLEEHVLNSVWVTGVGFLLTALVLFVADRPRQEQVELDRVSRPQWLWAGLIGVAQAIAILPGVSRSGSTIATALVLGWKRADALRIAFLMGLIAIGGASLLKAKEMTALDPVVSIAGLLSAFAFSLLGIALVSMVVRGRALKYFAIYVAIVGLVTLLWIAPQA